MVSSSIGIFAKIVHKKTDTTNFCILLETKGYDFAEVLALWQLKQISDLILSEFKILTLCHKLCPNFME